MKKFFILLITLLLLISAQHSFSEIYKYTDKDGNIRFTDKRLPEKANAETLKLKINTVKNPSIYNHSLGTSDKTITSNASDKTISNSTADKIIMYSATWCGVCKTAKKYFKNQGIPFREYDIEKSAKGRKDFKRLRGKGVPVILIGEQRMDGFDRSYFERLYKG